MSAWGNLLNIFETPRTDSLAHWPHPHPLPLPLPKPDPTADPSSGTLCHRVEAPCRPLFPMYYSWYAAEVDPNAFEIFGELCYKSVDEPPEEARRCPQGPDEAGGIACRRRHSDSRVGSGDTRPAYPPPISTIGRGGRPRVYFKSYRKDGRFVLKEIRIPAQQLLQSTWENGRLRMRVSVQDEVRVSEGEEEEDGKESFF